MMKQITITAAACLLLLACDDGPDDPGDAGADSSAPPMDARTPDDDAGGDAGDPDGCVDVTVATWRLDNMDDVSIRYRARISPELGGEPWDLYLDFQRYDTDYVGTFPLGEGMDDNFGGCARCVVAFFGTMLDRGYFASEGTLELREDPFSQKLDATLTDVRLVEVTIEADATGALVSTPVPGGACLDLAVTTVDQNFPSPGWTCPNEQFNDGAVCHCGCGAWDPDCGERCPFPPEPSCDPTPLPVEGCGDGELCTPEGMCSATCDHPTRVPCESGVCGFSADGDRCLTPSRDRVDSAALGELCTPGNFMCGVDAESFAMGICDDLDEWRCRPICFSDADCPIPGELCYTLFTGDRGFCRPPPPSEG